MGDVNHVEFKKIVNCKVFTKRFYKTLLKGSSSITWTHRKFINLIIIKCKKERNVQNMT